MRRIFRVNFALPILLLSLISISFVQAQSLLPPFAKYKVIPNPKKGFVTVEAWIELQNSTPYIKDFGQLQSISWLVGGKEIAVKSERLKDIIKKIVNASLQVAVLDIPANQDINWLVNSIVAVFQYAWQTIEPLEDQDYGIAIFPRGLMPQPGWVKWRSCVSSTIPMVPAHEILHFWRNNTPAWFREGVLEYISRKIMVHCGLMNEGMLQFWLRAGLVVHANLVKKQGTIKTLAESSDELERGTGGEDIYALMPVLAYKLDKEIQKHNPKSSLDEVYAAACRKPLWPQVNGLALIKDMTGYDPKPLFAKYFYAKVEKPEELLN